MMNKLRATWMSKTNIVASYLMKITRLHDWPEPIPITLNWFSSCWQCLFWGVCAQDKLPTFEKLWDDFIWEEPRLETIIGIEEEENLSLINKMKKGSKKGGLEKD